MLMKLNDTVTNVNRNTQMRELTQVEILEEWRGPSDFHCRYTIQLKEEPLKGGAPERWKRCQVMGFDADVLQTVHFGQDVPREVSETTRRDHQRLECIS